MAGVTDGVCGDVVSVRESTDVRMEARDGRVRVVVGVPNDAHPLSCAAMHVDTDFETARRMVEGTVSVLVVVSDGDGDE